MQDTTCWWSASQDLECRVNSWASFTWVTWSTWWNIGWVNEVITCWWSSGETSISGAVRSTSSHSSTGHSSVTSRSLHGHQLADCALFFQLFVLVGFFIFSCVFVVCVPCTSCIIIIYRLSSVPSAALAAVCPVYVHLTDSDRSLKTDRQAGLPLSCRVLSCVLMLRLLRLPTRRQLHSLPIYHAPQSSLATIAVKCIYFKHDKGRLAPLTCHEYTTVKYIKIAQ